MLLTNFATLAFMCIVSTTWATPLGTPNTIGARMTLDELKPSGDLPSKDRIRVIWSMPSEQQPDNQTPETSGPYSKNFITAAVLSAAHKGYLGPALVSSSHSLQFPKAPGRPPCTRVKSAGNEEQCLIEFSVEQGPKVLVKHARMVDLKGVAEFTVVDEKGKRQPILLPSVQTIFRVVFN
ncbi:hypothetical protein D9757_010725 [Collybiopsis confluens]|uniref:Uncharacterized protein n=1 Tax=Collybiopsis confluens TaxID=2823264 RepID=A0A8H5GZX2_9AGAR|nr:hypothetical protein D9757_010725 [Collybiopsis confluens]